MPENYGLQVENATGGVIIDSKYANHVYGGEGTINIAEETISNSSSGDTFSNVATISFGAAYDEPPTLLIKLGQASSGFTNCSNSCSYGSDRHFNFEGFNIDGNGKYTGFKYNRTRTSYAHGINFDYAWFIPADLVAEPNDSYGLIVKNGDGDTVFHSGHRYFHIIDEMKFLASNTGDTRYYNHDFSGGSYLQTSYASRSGGWFNKTDERPTSLKFDEGFHGYRTSCYDTITLPAGVNYDDVWFVVNNLNNSVMESGGENVGSGTYSWEEWIGGLTIWYGGTDLKVHLSGSNGAQSSMTTSTDDNPFTFLSGNGIGKNGTIYVPVAIIRD